MSINLVFSVCLTSCLKSTLGLCVFYSAFYAFGSVLYSLILVNPSFISVFMYIIFLSQVFPTTGVFHTAFADYLTVSFFMPVTLLYSYIPGGAKKRPEHLHALFSCVVKMNQHKTYV